MRFGVVSLVFVLASVVLASCSGGAKPGGSAGTTGFGGTIGSGGRTVTGGTTGSAGGTVAAGTTGSGGGIVAGGTTGSAGTTGATGTGGGLQDAGPDVGPSCPSDRRLCGADCVDTTGDTRHCGGCGQACATGEVCASSICKSVGDCRQTPCPGLAYCDLSNGQCKPGCALDSQCAANETCDLATHACGCKSGFSRCDGTCVANNSGVLACGGVCATCPTTNATAFACSNTSCVAASCTSGYHVCSGTCVSNSNVATCGGSCTPCPVPANGSATCNGTSCGITCNSGTMSCGGVCATCSSPGATSFACSGTSCVASACAASGYRLCGGVCAACPTTAVSTTTCSGTSCVAATCLSGYHACSGTCVANSSPAGCGSSCKVCPTVANGTATCDGVTCGTLCSTGYRLCGGVCALCPTPATSTTCGGTNSQQCVASACGSTRHVCAGACVLDTSVSSCGSSCTPCAEPPANGVASCDGTRCGITCSAGWARCGSACCPDCRGMSGACTGYQWCSAANGQCASIEKLSFALGDSVAISGTKAVVGAPSESSNTGAVYLFERQADGTWKMQGSKPLANPAATSTFFGMHVALSGQRLAVGSRTSTEAYVFDWTGTAWVQQLKVPGKSIGDNVGSTVAVDGDRVIVGAAGAAYIYERQSDGTWPSTGIKLAASDGVAIGYDVSISGDRALAGTTARAAYVFARQSDGTWTQEQILTIAGGARFDHFGSAVSLSGERAVVGANGDSQDAIEGVAYVFERLAGVWTETATIRSPAPAAKADDFFGGAVAMEGDRLLVGARGANRADNGAAMPAGAAYLFQRKSDGTWTAGVEVATHPDDVTTSRYYGSGVGLSGNFAIIRGAGLVWIADTRGVLP